MKKRSIKVTHLAAAVSVAMLQLGAAWADDAQTAAAQVGKTQSPPADSQSANGLNLDKVIVTGTPVGVSKMKASVSISTLDADQIQMAAPASSAEVLRSIPGIRSES